MRVLRAMEPTILELPSSQSSREGLDVKRRQQAADVVGVARCPRCLSELVPCMGRGRPIFWCRCPVRRMLAASA